MDGSARSGTSGRTRSTGLVLESAYARQRLAILHSLQVTSYAGSTAATEQSVTGNADCRMKWKPRLCISDGWAARRSPREERAVCRLRVARSAVQCMQAGFTFWHMRTQLARRVKNQPGRKRTRAQDTGSRQSAENAVAPKEI